MPLYIVPVPIGNLEDITLRALSVLKSVDFIICEDTRHSLKLLNHYKIKKRLVSYYKPKESVQAEKIVKELANKSAALISDSGTPLISDPGNQLILKSIENRIDIVPLPGPTAFVTAVSACGIPFESIQFIGFPPRKSNQLLQLFNQYERSPSLLVFYESPRRIRPFLETASEVFRNRQFVIARELSKQYEQIVRGNLNRYEAAIESIECRGEFVIIIEGFNKEELKTDVSIESMDDIFNYFKKNHSISKNQLKNILMKR